ncbi:hypothetical protein JZ751_016045 [Albula glossodonta]|uniref:Uncharacterized protein n=1 Tax=Albula glossodonta TaxID=121402 RepID=A0A8T2NYV8_9TELE|nr:hypothetical protein JZ751_016045 [Albula glossodonta]
MARRSVSLYKGMYLCRIRRVCCLKMAVVYTLHSRAETGLVKTPYTNITPSSDVGPQVSNISRNLNGFTTFEPADKKRPQPVSLFPPDDQDNVSTDSIHGKRDGERKALENGLPEQRLAALHHEVEPHGLRPRTLPKYASVVEECEITLTRTENRKADVSPRRYSTLTTTVCVKLLMNLPSYKGLEAEPAMKSPPWIHTITGRGFKRGNEKLVSRVCITCAGHSSEIGPMQACIQAGLGYVASYTPFHGDNGAGGFHRCAPTGGSANGIP